jgi:hypothetical protein
MSFSDKLKKHKTSYAVKKSYREAIEDLKSKYPHIRLDRYNRNFTGITNEFIDDLNREYSLCGIQGYEGVDRYYIASSNIEYVASNYSTLFNESEKEDDPYEELKKEQKESCGEKKPFKVNKEFLSRFDPMVTIFYIKIKNKK